MGKLIFGAILAGAFCSGAVRSRDVVVTEEPSVWEAQSAEEELFRNRDAIVRLMMWSMLYLEKRAPLLDRMPMEGVHRAFLESYIAVPSGLPQGVLAGGCLKQGLSSAHGKRKSGGKGIAPGIRHSW